jgi:tetratricopeptide (TPR) repeat protein
MFCLRIRLVPSPQTTRLDISDDLLTRLREDVVLRRIENGIEWFRAHRDLVLSLDPAQKNAAAFVGYFSQWMDIGYGDAGIVRELVTRFPRASRATLPLCDYIHLRLAEGMAASAEEEREAAIRHFDFIISLGEEVVQDKQLLALAHFWKGRCQRNQGEYDSALAHTVRGRELALELGYRKMAAVMQVLESWLYFQKDKLGPATEILEDAESALRETDDSVALGNIYSGYGRVALREGRYDQALGHFAKAIEWYSKRDPRHRNLARTLANMGYAKRLISLRLAGKIDREMAQRRKAATGDPTRKASADWPSRQRFERFREEAFSNLAQAEDIYSSLHHHRGLGTVRVDRGFLFLDTGDIERAGLEADEAYELAAERKDRILMARARILQSMIESAKYEEGIDEGQDQTLHAQRAQDYAKDALTLAHRTENRRLLARAYIRQGLTLCSDFFNTPEAAKECCDHAEEYLTPGNHDQLWEEFQALKARILRTGTVDAMLRKWSHGLTGDQTFQQMTEEFADLIIPKVWESEGRKVSRVAAKLSISPKKVRRILRRLGLKGD